MKKIFLLLCLVSLTALSYASVTPYVDKILVEIPADINDLSADLDKKCVTLTWSEVGADEYIIIRNANNSVELARVTGGSYTDCDLPHQKAWQYFVVPINYGTDGGYERSGSNSVVVRRGKN